MLVNLARKKLGQEAKHSTTSSFLRKVSPAWLKESRARDRLDLTMDRSPEGIVDGICIDLLGGRFSLLGF